METLEFCEVPTPVGRLLLVAREGRLCRVSFRSAARAVAPGESWRRTERPFSKAIAQLASYFAGRLRRFDLALSPDGTSFQREVWSHLQTIPYGEVTTYAEIARRLGRPRAFRAVGAANGSNPLPIIIPCHRVVGSDGSLTGFGGGLAVKRRLLELEGARSGLATGGIGSRT